MWGIICLSLLAAFSVSAVSKAVNPPFSFISNASQLVNINNASILRVPIPFGDPGDVQFSGPTLAHTAEIDFNLNNVASDEEWKKYTAKGRWYACLLDMTIEKAGKALEDPGLPPSSESIWQGDFREDIQNWGWHESTYDPDFGANFIDNNRIKPALDQLGLSALPVGKGGDNECWSIEHGDVERVDENGDYVPLGEQIYQINNDKYPCTGAYYRFAMNKKGGAIFAQSLLSPQAAADQNYVEVQGGDKLPHLRRASDILWSYWYRDNPDPRKLWAFFVNYVRNEETLPLVARIMRMHNTNKVPYYPGLILELERPDLEAEAILGSPIGSIVAHFLLQHRSRDTGLSFKHVTSIHIFRDQFPDDRPAGQIPEVQFLFNFGDVPLDELDDGPEMPPKPPSKKKRTVEVLDKGEKNTLREHRVLVNSGVR